jgi:catechol 2,3-dioxygenase-like lactoylglutathione lyase family enzyme
MTSPLTRGIDHVGLTVRSLEASLRFFVEGLNWTKKGERPDYPASFVSDGTCLVTLWQVKDQAAVVEFDRHRNIGLHHLALKVPSEAELHAIFERVSNWPGVVVEFSPEPSGKGPKIHFMIREPGGNRIEFAWDSR